MSRPRRRLVTIAQRARTWLAAVIEESGGDESSLLDLVSCTIGAYLCDALEGRGRHSFSRRVCRLLAGKVANCSSSVASIGDNPARTLVAQCICSGYGLDLFASDSLIHSIADGFAIKPVESTEELLALVLQRRNGLIDKLPSVPKIVREDVGKRVEILMADDDRLRQIHDLISLASLFGSVRVNGESGVISDLIDLLPPVILQRLRIYDLELGAMLLRALAYLNSSDTKTLRSGVCFLEGQQRDDGAFGYFALNLSQTSENDGALHRSLYLNTTCDCLWTIAELRIPRFRLFTAAMEGSKSENPASAR